MDIVEELRRDRESGARRLEAEYKIGLMTLARRFCLNDSDAEELVNATFATVVENIDSYVEQSAFFAWMCQILRSKLARNARRKSSQLETFTGDMPEIPDETAEGEAYRALDASLLRDAIETLPPDIRKTLLLHYFMDMPVKEVARVLSAPTSTITWRLHYARKILAAKLGAAAKKPGGKALLLALALCGLSALGAAVWNLAVPGEAQDMGGAASGRTDVAMTPTSSQTGLSGISGLSGEPEALSPPTSSQNPDQTVFDGNRLQSTEIDNFTTPGTQSTQGKQDMNATTLRTFVASAALAAATVTPLAATADIVVPAGEMLTISSTPAEQPGVIDVHGALFVSGGAVVMPSTLRVGCAAGDDASATLYDTASRLGYGYNRVEGGFAPTFVQIGAGGGAGKLVNDGGDSGNSWQSGIGGAFVSIAPDALAGESGTIDFLELRSGYARFWSMTNESARSARVLFTGGTWVTGQGWGPRPWAKGAFVWESANGADIRVELGNYGNTLTLGETDGSLAVRGTGDFRIRCGWGDASNNNGVFDVRKAISWEGSGDLVISDNAKLRLFCSDALPHGAGRGAVRLAQVNSRLVLNAGTTNRVNSLLAPSGQVTGTGTLVFGEAVGGSLQATFLDAATVVKRGAGTTLSVTGATTGASASLAVEAGTVRVGAPLSLKAISVAPGASLVVDGATATVSSFEGDASAVTCVNGGSLVVERSDSGDAFVEGACAPDVLAVTGGGNVVLADPAALPAVIRLDSGSLSFTALGCADTWYRFTFKQTSNAKPLVLREIALFDENSEWFWWAASTKYTDAYDAPAISRGDLLVRNAFPYDWYWQGPTKLFDGPDGSAQGTKFNGSTPSSSDESTWTTITLRLPEGADAVSGYDLCSPSWDQGDPLVWMVESSADGATWRTVSDVPSATGTRSANKWRGGQALADGPTRYFTLTNYVSRGIATDVAAFSADLASGTALDVSAVTNGYALSSLALDASAAAAPTVTGARFAASGDIAVSGVASSVNPEPIEIPLLLENCENTDALTSWTLWIDGRKRGHHASYDADAHVLRFTAQAFVIVVR
ncbi:MAG: sigma-70 family RNA polymerase sigma factor [Kiritimatiellae bacterium]|nr:sigma-70 family RNA polymerase sigma factor [Kiritimatiellia bacterium]